MDKNLIAKNLNKIVDVVKWSFKFSKEYMAKSVKVQQINQFMNKLEERYSEEIENKLGLTVMGIVPKVEKE